MSQVEDAALLEDVVSKEFAIFLQNQNQKHGCEERARESERERERARESEKEREKERESKISKIESKQEKERERESACVFFCAR